MDEMSAKIVVLIVIVAVPALIGAAVATYFAGVTEIEDESITGAKIAANAVAGEELADASVDLNKLSAEVIEAIAAGKEIPIEGKDIVNEAIIESKLAENSVTGKKIADETISNADIATNAAIEDSKLAGLYLQLAVGLDKGNKVLIGSMNFGEFYSGDGEKVDLRALFLDSIKAVIVEPSKNGYLFSVDSNGFQERTFKIKAMYFDPTAGEAWPAIEVKADTNLSMLTNVQFIAIGR